jgi:hypothetical protein
MGSYKESGNMDKRNFLVDYTFKKGSSQGRMKIQGSALINLKTAQSDFAVYEYLKQRHPDCDINIMSIKWI